MADFTPVSLLDAYEQQKDSNQKRQLADLQQQVVQQGLLEKVQKMQQDLKLKAMVAQSGGDVDKALEAALTTGNYEAAHQLAPLVKLAQERRASEATPGLLADIYRQGGAAPQQPQELGAGQPVSVAGESPAAPAAPQSPDQARQARIAQLTAMSMIPKYANNPVVQQRIQAEIDKLSSVKPMVEHNYSIGGDKVQPHISFDEGRSWQPVPGSQPSAKFARQVPNATPAEQAPAVTDDTLAMDAWRYLTDGTLPPNMGRGVQGTAQATKIRNEASRLAKDMGMTPDEIRMAQLTNKTQVQAIGQLAKAKAQILQFEKTAEYNADLALKASSDVWRTGSPLFNRPVQWLRENAAGDPAASRFNAATETFVSEYARVMSGGYGAAQTTEGAQIRAHKLLNTAQGGPQFEAVVGQLRLEMKNRVKALNDQMDEERRNLRSGVRPTAPSPAPAAAPTPAGGGWSITPVRPGG